MTDELQSNNADSATPSKPRNRKWAVVDSIARWIFGLLVIAASLHFVNEQLRPPVVDDNLTIEIIESDPSSESDPSKSDPSESDPSSETTSEDETSDDDDLENVNTSDRVEPVSPKRLTDMISTEQIESAEHPMDPLLAMADRGLEIIDSKYRDYTAKIVTQVRTGKTLHDKNGIFLKVRHPGEASETDSDSSIPFSVYTRFLQPKSKTGQEAIWVEGRDDGKILGHGTGIFNVRTVRLEPEGSFAMSGNRYPIYEIGFRNLVTKMKQFGENDRQYDECSVKIDRNVLVDERPCTLITVTHPVEREHFEYHIAKIYIDDEYEIPTGYEGYLWPESEGGEPVLLEQYFYIDLQLNVDLKDVDFDTANPDYDYPAW